MSCTNTTRNNQNVGHGNATPVASAGYFLETGGPVRACFKQASWGCRKRMPGRGLGRGFDDKGSAILLVISVGALVTLMVFTWVAFSVQRYRTAITMRDRLHARYAAESVVSKALYGRMTNPPGAVKQDSLIVARMPDTLHAEDSSSRMDSSLIYSDTIHHSNATASISEEGSFLRIKAAGSAGDAACEVDALFGYELSTQYRFALILSEQNKRLEIRKGRIIGDAWLAHQPDGPVQGKVETGVAELPRVAAGKFIQDVKEFENKMRFPEKSETVLQGSQVFNEQSPPPLDSGKNLFVNGNVLIESGTNRPFTVKGPGSIIAAGSIQISGQTVLDNVELLALDKVQCFDNARLRNTTVFSMTTIGLGDDVRCSGNFYAFENIVLAGNAVVEMPAFAFVRGVLKKNALTSSCGVRLSGESRFSGIVFCEQGFTFSSIEKNARFTGLFYTRGYLALEGTVYGCVAAQRMKKDIESDKNEFAGGTIDRKMLPKNFTVPCAFGQNKKGGGDIYKLVSWKESFAVKGRNGVPNE